MSALKGIVHCARPTGRAPADGPGAAGLPRLVRYGLLAGVILLALSGSASVVMAQSTTSPASAPTPSHAGTTRHGMAADDSDMGAMMALMMESPHAILTHRAKLGLSNDQIDVLRSLDRQATATHDSVMQAMGPLHARMAKEVEANPVDETAIRSAADQMGALHARMMFHMLEAVTRARAALTPDQRLRLSAITRMPMKEDHGMHGMNCGQM